MNRDLKDAFKIIGVIMFLIGVLTFAILLISLQSIDMQKRICKDISNEGHQTKIVKSTGRCKIVYKGLLFDPESADQINLLKIKDIGDRR